MTQHRKIVIPNDAWSVLAGRLTEERRDKMQRAASRRTEQVRLVLQDVHNAHNVSACLRSAEAFGVLNIDVVTLGESFKPSSVARGVTHWLNITHYSSIAECAHHLHENGFLIAAAYPSGKVEPTVNLRELPCTRPLALLFGNEHAGIAAEWQEHVDIYFTIPMYGMVESLNISVSAAIAMESITGRMRESLRPEHYYLNPTKKSALLSRWICNHFPAWEAMYRRTRMGTLEEAEPFIDLTPQAQSEPQVGEEMESPAVQAKQA